jgi:hypothetical protein
LERFGIIAPFVAVLLATAAPATLAGATWYGPADKAPYGAASLYLTDPARLTKSISYQLLRAGLGGPRLDLFPAAPTSWDGWFQPGPPVQVRGLNPYSVEYRFIERNMDRLPYDALPPCQTSEFQRQGPMPDLVEVGLHEVAHYVSFRLGLDPMAYGKLKREADAYNRDPSTPQAAQVLVTYNNVNEDISDVSAVFYIYSNYLDMAVNDAEAQAKADMRIAEYLDWEHDTSRAMMAARTAFLRNPRYGLGVVETTRWAARLVADLPLAAVDARVEAAAELGDPLEGDAAFDARLRGAHDRIIAARNRFCGIG